MIRKEKYINSINLSMVLCVCVCVSFLNSEKEEKYLK